MKRFFSIFMILCMTVAFSACGKDTDTQEAETATNVTVFEVTTSDINSEVSYTGEIKASEESTVTPKSSGIVKSLYYDIGDYVTAGATLAVLDDTDYRLAYNQALASYNSALASYNSVTNGSLKQSQSQLESAVSAAQIEYNSALDNYNRQKALYEAGAISKVNFEAAETRLENAELNLNTAKNNYDITINEVNKDSERSAKAAVDSAKAMLDSAANNLNNTVVTAPISGYVASRSATIGQMAAQGSPIFSIKSDNIVNAELSVTESVIPYITVGTDATVSVESAGLNDIKGKVSEVNTIKSDATGMYTVRVQIDNPDGKLKIGMFADITLNTANVNNAVVIPSESVMQTDDEYYVYVVKGDTAEKRAITTGISNNDFTEVKDGLKTGEKIVVSGKEYLSEKNNKVKIVEE